VDIFRFISWCLIAVYAVTLIFPVNVALVALAYKVKLGGRPIDMEPGEFWWRCSFAALGLAGLSLVLIAFDYGLIASVQMPAGPVQLTLFLLYLPAAIGFLFWILGMDDVMNAASVFVLYILLPGLPLLLIGRIAHLWEKLQRGAPWLWSQT